MPENMYGIWIGENSVVAVTSDFTISFLRLGDELTASILRCNHTDFISVTYGHGTASAFRFTASAWAGKDGKTAGASRHATDELVQNHLSDRISYDEQRGKLIYFTLGNKVFENVLAEKIEMSFFSQPHEIDNTLSVAEKMARWNRYQGLSISQREIRAGIDTRKYSILYNVNLGAEPGDDEFIYCRVGRHGYCEKGWAMLPTVLIRHYLVDMSENILSSIDNYEPMEECFAEGSCAFPPDGGWYWSVKEITDDIISLHGCQGDIYKIYRIQDFPNAS